MIEIHQYPSIWGLSSLSPFCIKVEVFCKMAKIPYEIIVETNPLKGPKGKMPFIVDRKNNKRIPDSSFILDYLYNHYDCRLIENHTVDGELYAFQKMIEESLYFFILYNRWVDPSNKNTVINGMKKLFPPFIGTTLLNLIRVNLIKQSKSQGIGRHSKEEVYFLAVRELQAIASRLEGRKYFGGENISSIDPTVYSFIILILKQPISSPLKTFVENNRELMRYVKDIERLLF